MNAYIHPREGLYSLKSDLHSKSCKIAFLNSITAQKDGYVYQLAAQINAYLTPNHELFKNLFRRVLQFIFFIYIKIYLT